MIKTTFYTIFLPIIIFGVIILIVELFKYFKIEVYPKVLIPLAIWLVGGIIYRLFIINEMEYYAKYNKYIV